ncbi:MAG TPA: hypothetical protein DEH25_05975 [Chloroflexi bacterium]|nr:hypothetical protein [Chloroflexota bacterium]
MPGELKTLYTTYSPALIEWMVGAGVVAFGLTAFTLGVNFLKVVDHGVEKEAVTEKVPATQTVPAMGD